ncbi:MULTISPECIES: hypothetical protein [Sphingomonas]|uniref:hypothetical protein n=1 Tax=Sphingomonas TaxID=13687 RepID=UPI000ABFA38E|nr:hypothetical protein [Sphingomonas pituitosa]
MLRRQTRTISLNQVLSRFVNDDVSVRHRFSASGVVRTGLRALTERLAGRRAVCDEAACG